MRYTVNLVRDIRLAEKREEAKQAKIFATSAVCFAVLMLSLLYLGFEVFRMLNVLSQEKKQLKAVEVEYRKYQATKMIVNKADVELLDQLQNDRIFWTKKLASVARHLPGKYWITKFEYDRAAFRAEGYGYISGQQEQLIVLNRYFNLLRSDGMYNDDFKSTVFNSTERKDEKGRRRVSFEFSSTQTQSR